MSSTTKHNVWHEQQIEIMTSLQTLQTTNKNVHYWISKDKVFAQKWSQQRVSVLGLRQARADPRLARAEKLPGRAELLLAMLDPSPVSVSHISQCHASSQNLYYQSIQLSQDQLPVWRHVSCEPHLWPSSNFAIKNN